MDGHSAKISGGVQIDGTEIGPVIEREVLEQAQIIKDRGLRSVAIVGIYSPLDEKYSQEHQVRSLLRKALGNGVNIICSRESTMTRTTCCFDALLTMQQFLVLEFCLVKTQPF